MVRENDLSSLLLHTSLQAASLLGAVIQCLYKISSQLSRQVFCKSSQTSKGLNCTHQDDDALACLELQQEE